MLNHDIEYGGSDTESEKSEDDEPICPPNKNEVTIDCNANLSKEKPPARIICPTTNDFTEVSTTITDTAESEATTIITCDYFLTKKQRLNNEMKIRDGERWVTLKNRVNDAIDGELKDRMLVEAQRLQLMLMLSLIHI